MKDQIRWIITLAVVLAAWTAHAQEKSWEFKLTPYLWTLGMEGDLGVGGLTAPVDIKFTDAIKNLSMGGMLAAEAHNGTWGVLLDGTYLRLTQDEDTRIGRVDVEVEEWILQGALVYRIIQAEKTHIDVGAGARAMNLSTDLTTPIGDPDMSENWVDPIACIRFRQQFTESAFGVLAADIGGFDAASKLTWQLTAGAGYSFTETIAAVAAYRYLDYDYSDDGFTYKVSSSGLALGLQFNL
jgi:opacity protein-like surface antigen